MFAWKKGNLVNASDRTSYIVSPGELFRVPMKSQKGLSSYSQYKGSNENPVKDHMFSHVGYLSSNDRP